MEELPPEVAASVVRAFGKYLRNAPATEVPRHLRRYRGFRPGALTQHTERLLRALEDEDLRAAVLKWLGDSRPKMQETDEQNFRLVLERPPGWTDKLTAPNTRPQTKRARPAAPDVDKVKESARIARDELKRARREARDNVDAANARAAELSQEIARLRATVAEAERKAARSEAVAAEARDQLEREKRRARRDADKARAERDEMKAAAGASRRELTAARREIAELSKKVERLEAASVRPQRSDAHRPRQERPRKRMPLPVPKGRFPEDPQTLDEWMSADGVQLIVDGYNAARAQRAFGDLDLVGQRERLIQEIFGIAVRRKIPAIIVFDGAEVGPGTRRRSRGPVRIEYSKASETADDHLVALLDRLPPDPVIVVTNDRELQERAAERGATIATSDQLIGLIR